MSMRREQRDEMLDRLHPRLIGRGWRLLDDNDVIERADQAAYLSTLLNGTEDWCRLDKVSPDYGDEWADVIGKTVAAHVDDRDSDGWERIFRRKVTR